ncbi:hypothetical protein SRABI128_06292 [Microbacterium sp. Bi128]|nr:hypothetical protein SRABI128_06292 [Microbacterium sp. Bi128]
MVDGRVGPRRLGVVADEFVLQSPGLPAGEGACQPGSGEVRIGQGIFVQLLGAALVSAEKCGAELGCDGPGTQHGVQPGRIHDAARSHQRKVDGGPHLGE